MDLVVQRAFERESSNLLQIDQSSTLNQSDLAQQKIIPQFIVPDLSSISSQELQQLSHMNTNIWEKVYKNPDNPYEAFKNSVIQILNCQGFVLNPVHDLDHLQDIHQLLIKDIKGKKNILALQFGQDWYITVGYNFTHTNPIEAYSKSLQNGQFWLIMSSCSQYYPNFMSKKWKQVMMATKCPEDCYVNLQQRKPQIRKVQNSEQKKKTILWEVVGN